MFTRVENRDIIIIIIIKEALHLEQLYEKIEIHVFLLCNEDSISSVRRPPIVDLIELREFLNGRNILGLIGFYLFFSSGAKITMKGNLKGIKKRK